jgi:hypothetical protein
LSLHDTQLETVTIIERVTKKKQRKKNKEFKIQLFFFLFFSFLHVIYASDKIYSQRNEKERQFVLSPALPPTAQRLKALRLD